MPYLIIKIAVDDGLSPGFVAWSRVTLAALVLLPVAWRTGALRGLPLRWLALFATTEIAIPFPLIGFGEQRISSSLAAILIATLPLVVAFLALRFDHAERPTPTRLAGMLIGLGGVAVLVGIDIGGRGAELLGAGAVLLATIGYAIGPLIVKRKTVITYVNPIVALALGVAVLGEDATAGATAGLLLILAGSWLATDGRLPPGLATIAGRAGARGDPRAAPRMLGHH